MQIENLNCPNCGGPVQIPNNKIPFNCMHCGSALVLREEAGVSLLELSDKLTNIIESGNQEIISAIKNNNKESADTRLYQSQIEQELTALSVQLVPLKSEFSTLQAAKRDANVAQRLRTVSIQIYMLLERTRLLQGKLNEIKEPKKSPLDQLYEQYMYIQSELAYLSYAGESPDVRQFKANLTAQYTNLEKQMMENINSGLASSSLGYPLENDVQVLTDRLRIIQGDIRAVSTLAASGATQKVLKDLRTKEKEVNNLIWKINSETRRVERQKQSETKLADLQRIKEEILKKRKLTLWESVSLSFRKQSIRHPALLFIGGFIFFCGFCVIPVALLGSPSTAAGTIPPTAQDISVLQTAAFQTAVVEINQKATAVAYKQIPTITPTLAPTLTLVPVEGVIVQDLSNMRSSPNLDAPILIKLGINTKVFAVSSSTDNNWLLVIDESGTTGWIHNTLARFSTSVESLPVSTETFPTPMPSSTPLPTETARPSWVDQPPIGKWCKQNASIGVCAGAFEYRNNISYSVAANGNHFIVFAISVKNLDYSDILASPYDVTIVMENGRTFNFATETYSFTNGFEVVTISPDNYTSGAMVFLVPSNIAPRKIIYNGGLFDENIVLDLQDPPTP